MSTTTARATLLALGSATLGESGARRMHERMRPVWHGARVAAQAYTAVCADGDNLAIHVAIAEAPAGTVLVAQIDGHTVRGFWGEVLTTGAEARGVRGLVIDGGVRDLDALEAHRFPVFATTIALRGASKEKPGEVGTTATVGDVDVASGDWIVGDADGVVVVPVDELDQVCASATVRAAKEAEMFVALRAGRTTIELLGLDTSLVRRPR